MGTCCRCRCLPQGTAGASATASERGRGPQAGSTRRLARLPRLPLNVRGPAGQHPPPTQESTGSTPAPPFPPAGWQAVLVPVGPQGAWTPCLSSTSAALHSGACPPAQGYAQQRVGGARRATPGAAI